MSASATVPADQLVRIADTLESALSSSREVIDLVVTTFAAGGHLLLEDVPGVGKTTLARAMGQAIGGQASRIQFTPDLLPSDLTGVSIYARDAHDSNSIPARCSPTSSSPTRSIAPTLKPNPPCWRP